MTGPRVALLDSGVFVANPHLDGATVGGFGLVGDEPPLQRSEDFSDVTGHGTAAAAALVRLVPDVDLLAIRLLDDELRTTSVALAHAIVLAAEEGARVINLSLGSGAATAQPLLAAAVADARDLGAICVASAHPRGRALWPADLPDVISATTHRACPLSELYAVEGPLPRFLAHGFPRPIEGRAPTDNLYGPSFAAVHVTARVVGLLRAAPDLDFDGVVGGLRAAIVGRWAS